MEIRAEDIREVEEFAARIADQQDNPSLIKEKDETIVINNYKKYWISDSEQGHIIKICHGNDDKVLTIKCNWEDRKRDKTNRVRNVKIKNYA